MVSRPGTDEATLHLEMEGLAPFDRLAPRDGLQSVVVDQRVGMVGVAEITFAGLEQQWSALSVGATVVLRVRGVGLPLFEGRITAFRHRYHEGAATLTVVASDALHTLAAPPRSRAFGDPDAGVRHTDSDIVERVLADHGLAPRVDRSEARHPYVVQRNETDLAFVLRLAARNDWVVTAEGPTTVVCGRRPTETTLLIDRAVGLVDLEYTVSPHAVPDQVAVSGWNYLTKTSAPGFESRPSDGDPTHTLWLGDAQIEESTAATALARGVLQRAAHGLVRGRARVVGRGEVRPHRIVAFTGHPDGFNPTGYVVAARHRLIDGHYVTDLRFTSHTAPGVAP